MMKNNKLQKILQYFSLVIILVGFYFLFRKGDWSKVLAIKNNINYPGLVLVLILFTTSQFLMIVRWYLLLIPVKKEIALKSVFRIAISAIVLNKTAPGKIGYPTKAYFLKKVEDIPVSSSLPSLFGELLLDYSVTGVFFVVSALAGNYFRTIFQILSKYINLQQVWLIPLAMILIVMLLLILKQKLQSSNFFNNIFKAIGITSKRKDLILLSFGLTIIALFLWFVCDYVLLASLGYTLPFSFLIFVGAFTNIMVLLAPLPGGLGVREISGAYLFELFFNLGEVAVVMVLLSRLFAFMGLAILYFVEWLMQLLTPNKEVVTKVVDLKVVSND